MKIAIYGKVFSAQFVPYIEQLIDILYQNKAEIYIYQPFREYLRSEYKIVIPQCSLYTSKEDFETDCRFMVSIGGDGTFLEAVTYVGNSNIPLIGINSGRLGFLANISKENIVESIKYLFNSHVSIEERDLIEIVSPENIFGDLNFGLNEVTIQHIDNSMITVHTFIGDEYLNSYWTDGLIISTPTGSTAYSISVGGPIIVPSVNNFVISPIATHNLSVRPIVVPNNLDVILRVEGRSSSFKLTIDNRQQIIDMNTEVRLRKASYTINMVKLPNLSFYNTLRNKLMWGIDRRN